MAFGALLGALLGGYYVDKIGRLRTFLLDLFFFIVAAVFAAFAPNLIWLLAFRFLMGVGVGLDFPVALSFIAEYTATQHKGRSVNLWQMTWHIAATAGFLVIIPVYLLGAGPDLWRYAVGFGAIPASIVLVLRYMYMDESPMWAANRGDIQGAVRILRKTYGIDVVAAPDATKPLLADTSAISFRDYKQIFTGRYRPRTILAGAVGMTMGAMSFPTAIRGIGSGFTQAVIRVGSILGFYFFPLVLAAVGLDRTLLILTIVPLIGLLFTRFTKWDPTGRDVDAEEVELAGEVAARTAAAA